MTVELAFLLAASFVIWLFIAPFMILGRLRELQQKLHDLEMQLARFEPPKTPKPEETYVLLKTSPPETSLRIEPEEAVKAASPQEETEEGQEEREATEIETETETGTEIKKEAEKTPVLSFFEEEHVSEEKQGSKTEQFFGEEQAFGEERGFDGEREVVFLEDEAPSPTALETGVKRLFSWLLREGNIWVCAGVALFFTGFGLLFNYAVQMGWLTVPMRLSGAAATGIAMAAFGFRMRERRRSYALILQGGGLGILYLVTLGASKLYAILPPEAAIIMMLVLAAFTVLLALLQNFEPLAVFAVLGGYVAPILVSTGSRNHVALFSIYALLNGAILLISLKKDWRILTRTGFVLTVAVGVLWGRRD